MANYTLWYTKKINAKNLADVLKKAKKVRAEFHSLESNKDDEREHQSCIGFQTNTEYDYED